MAKQLSIIFGVAFVLTGLLGYFDNPIVGANGYFATNAAHNVAHLLLGAILLLAGLSSGRAAFLSLTGVGAVYLLLAIIGFAAIGGTGTTMLLGIVHINGADNWLHLVLGIVVLTAGLARRQVGAVRTAHR